MLLAALLAVVACDDDSSSPSEPNRQTPAQLNAGVVVLAVGQSALVTPAALLTFEQVVSDSRCPLGVTCVWAGEVTLALSLESGAETLAFQLSDRSNSASVRGLRFELLSVTPYPLAGYAIPIANYRASILVTDG